MIKPVFQDDAFLAEVATARADGEWFHLWWLGQSGFLVQCQGHHLLLDPYLSDSLTKKYAATDKPHVRMTERVVAPERLDFIEVVTSSHAHTDHLDPETLKLLAAANPGLVLICPEATRATVRERSGLPDEQIIGLDAEELRNAEPGVQDSAFRIPHSAFERPVAEAQVGLFSFHAVPAAHETLERDDHGRLVRLGYVVQFGPWTIYHSGDTVWFDGLADWLRPWRIDVALLPINGRAPERRVAGNLRGREAAQLAKHIGARLVIPCHYEMFEFNTATPAEFVAAASELGQPHVVLRAGERWTNAGTGRD
ncbi:MAG: MBL fold metallo-hydrolase [Verrucomicrobia bacterium]|nr:MBL fold metallo-hydrolase [Verrucomicrobiota bacterium]